MIHRGQRRRSRPSAQTEARASTSQTCIGSRHSLRDSETMGANDGTYCSCDPCGKKSSIRNFWKKIEIFEKISEKKSENGGRKPTQGSLYTMFVYIATSLCKSTKGRLRDVRNEGLERRQGMGIRTRTRPLGGRPPRSRRRSCSPTAADAWAPAGRLRFPGGERGWRGLCNPCIGGKPLLFTE